MQTISAVIERLGGASVLASKLHLPSTTVASWKHRGSIPVDHWRKLVATAEEAAVDGITYEKLVELHAQEDREAS